MNMEETETALCGQCNTFVPKQKIVAWKNPENGVGICWECYPDET